MQLFDDVLMAVVSAAHSYLTYKGGIFFGAQSSIRFQYRCNSFEDVSDRITLWHYIGAVLPVILAVAILLGLLEGKYILDWTGWVAVSVSGFLFFALGLRKGRIYARNYLKVLWALDQGEEVLDPKERIKSLPHHDECIAFSLTYRGIEPLYATRITKLVLANLKESEGQIEEKP